MPSRKSLARPVSDKGSSLKTSPSQISFSSVTHAHCHVLATLHQMSFEKPWSADEFGHLLNHSGTGGYIALNVESVPLGFVLARCVVDEAEILTLCTAPQYRGQKIASSILNHLVEEYDATGINTIFLEVAEDNSPATGLYCKCGFTTVGERPEYYRKSSETAKKAIVMARSN